MKIGLIHSREAGELACDVRSILEKAGSDQFQITALSLLEPKIGSPAAQMLENNLPDVMIICLAAAVLEESIPLVATLLKLPGATPVVLVTSEGKQRELDELIKLGATDFILVPVRPQELLHRLSRLALPDRAGSAATRRLKESLGLRQFIGESEAFLQEIAKVPKLAQCDVAVLIGGETGTGKEMVARAIHHLSGRSAKPFIPVNCGALPDDLVENELFGHYQGAFTGANSSSFGLIHEADGGTLFLDEVDALPARSQVKLLRFLQEKEYRPLGSSKSCQANVRVLAASNADMEETMRSGRFRSDLYYRLNVVPLHLPPLRERQKDIALLAQHFLRKHSMVLKVPARGFSPTALQKLRCYHWPGNIRELENLVERALILSEHSVIDGQEICLPDEPLGYDHTSFKVQKAKVITAFERNYLQQLLLDHGGNISQAARAAKKHRRALWQLLRKHHLSSPRTVVQSC